MRIDVLFSPLLQGERDGKIVVVLDILRATSSMITAFGHKAEAIVPVLEPQDALALRQQDGSGLYLVGGERRGLIIPGFDLGNSPSEYTEERVRGKKIMMCTTNGTKALRWARGAKEILVGAFLNVGRVVAYLKEREEEVLILCAGRDGNFSLEDAACAGMIVSCLAEKNNCMETGDSAKVARYIYEQAERIGLESYVAQTEHGQYLRYIGMEQDLQICAGVDRIPVLPKYGGEEITLEAPGGVA